MKPLSRRNVVHRARKVFPKIKIQPSSSFNASVSHKRQIGTSTLNHRELARQLQSSQQEVKVLKGKNLKLQRTINLQIPKVAHANLSKMMDHLKLYMAIVQKTMQLFQNPDADIDVDTTILNPDIDLSTMAPPNTTKQSKANSKQIMPRSARQRSARSHMHKPHANDIQEESTDEESTYEESTDEESSDYGPIKIKNKLVQKTRAGRRHLHAAVVLDKMSDNYKPSSNENSNGEKAMESNNERYPTTRTSSRNLVKYSPQSPSKRQPLSRCKSAQSKMLADSETIEPADFVDDDSDYEPYKFDNTLVLKTRASPRKLGAMVVLDKITNNYKPSSNENSNSEDVMESDNEQFPATRSSPRKLIKNRPQSGSKRKSLNRHKSAQSKILVGSKIIDDNEPRSKGPPSRQGTNQAANSPTKSKQENNNAEITQTRSTIKRISYSSSLPRSSISNRTSHVRKLNYHTRSPVRDIYSRKRLRENYQGISDSSSEVSNDSDDTEKGRAQGKIVNRPYLSPDNDYEPQSKGPPSHQGANQAANSRTNSKQENNNAEITKPRSTPVTRFSTNNLSLNKLRSNPVTRFSATSLPSGRRRSTPVERFSATRLSVSKPSSLNFKFRFVHRDRLPVTKN